MPTVDMIKTGDNIQTLRKESGLSIRDMQEIFGFASGNAIYKWINGQSMPTIDNLVILASIFNTTIDSIVAIKII